MFISMIQIYTRPVHTTG